MKQLTCEMCGGTELVKQDGVYVCQNCGTKYSVEEARKLMIEGTVEITGVVEVDDSAKIEKIRVIANRNFRMNNFKEALNYFTKILEYNPEDWEAQLYVGYCHALSCRVSEIRDELRRLMKSNDEAIEVMKGKLLSGEYSLDECAEHLVNVTETSINVFKVLGSAAQEHLTITEGIELTMMYAHATMMSCLSGFIIPDIEIDVQIRRRLCEVCKDLDESVLTPYWLTCGFLEKYHLPDVKKGVDNLIYNSSNGHILVWNYIREFDPCFQSETEKRIEKAKKDSVLKSEDFGFHEKTSNNKKSDGCYVATAIYGSYDCPQVWTLRRYRDYTLAESWYGRAFIRTYYAISPSLVKWFGHTYWFKKMWQGKLDKIVKKLQENGVESTPYEDKEW